MPLETPIGEALPNFANAISYKGEAPVAPVNLEAEPPKEAPKEPPKEEPKAGVKVESPKEEPKVEAKEPAKELSIFDTPKAEPKDDEAEFKADFERNNIKTDEGKALWKTIKTENKELKKERETLQKQIEEFKAKVSPEATEQHNKAMEALRAELLEAKKIIAAKDDDLAMASVERTPKFKAEVTEPREAVLKSLKELAESKELKLRDLLDPIIEGDNAKFREVLEGLSPIDQHEALDLRKQYLATKQKEDVYRNTSSEKLKELLMRESKEQEEAKIADVNVFRTASRGAFTEASKRFSFLKEHPDNPNAAGWNQSYRAAIASSELADPTVITAQDAGMMHAAFQLQPFLEKGLEHFTNRVQQLEEIVAQRDKTIAEITSGNPGVNGRANDTVAKAEPKPEELNFASTIDFQRPK